ncbi:hypothetical protein HFO51_06345 [Rhizobium leguminosarum]|uniref:MobA/MobL family protein n=1 Tax=Rhizobium leguminosarum TaxID=384 RepID=UPI001C97CDF5|nr:MobA/MobL family protein [Rhizobium leguminosarum]MBY5594087.1 hypothetical protein [Rhizobium leguminosarum]
MATVTAFLKHSHVGKGTQAEPYTAAAHARYVTRRQAASLIYSERMPRQYHAVQRFLNEHEDGLRKNGRVIDKFIISVPHEVSQQDAAAALKRFGYRMGKGKAPFLFALHGFDTRNHHAHFIFIDRDPDTGRRIFGTSEKGSSADIKLEWETAANDTFEELGYDVRVKIKEGYELHAENDNAPLCPDKDIDEATADASVPETEDARAGDESLAGSDDNNVDQEDRAEYQGTEHGYRIKKIFSTTTELNRLRDARARIAEADLRLRNATKERENANLAASVYTVQSERFKQSAYNAREALRQHQTAAGSLKGFRFKVFGWEVKTPGRKAAEAALDRVEVTEGNASYAALKQEELNFSSTVAEANEQAAERELLLRRNELVDIYGDEEAVNSAEATLENTLTKHLHAINKNETSVQEVVEALANDEITFEEFRTYLVASGQEALLSAYEEGVEQGEDL